MAKHCILSTDPHQVNTSVSKPLKYLDGNICILCQHCNNENLVCPEKSKRFDKCTGYKSLSKAFYGFHKMNALPHNLKLEMINDGEGLENTFENHNASCHTICKNNFSVTSLQKQRKRSNEISKTGTEEVISKHIHVLDPV